MGVLIKFPYKEQNHLSKEEEVKQEGTSEEVPQDSFNISSFEDKKQEKAFENLLREWPCYTGMSLDLVLEEILDMYYDDELTVQQDYVLEYLFHMHDPKSSFDIANALYSWGENDRNFFILSLNLHSEIIDQIKKQEY